jgi:Uma2 family endonuclease
MWPQGYPDSLPNAMAGAQRNHNRIKYNVESKFGAQLDGGPCEISSSDQQVWNEAAEFAAFPDVVVHCVGARFEQRRGLETLLDPRVIIEILSASTENFDRKEKFAYYREFASLREYLLIDTRRYHIEHFQRMEGGAWSFSVYNSSEDEIVLPSIGCRLALNEIYARVEFPPEPNSRWPRLVR